MYCTHCGSRVEQRDSFCANCGAEASPSAPAIGIHDSVATDVPSEGTTAANNDRRLTFALVGGLVGAMLGYVFRPSVFLVGQVGPVPNLVEIILTA